MDRRPMRIVTLLTCCVLLATRAPASVGFDEARLRADVDSLSSHPTRFVGSEGYRRALEYLRGEINAVVGGDSFRQQDFPIMVPVTESASLSLEDGSSHELYPFWPAGVRPNATPADGISGRLVYCGKATLAEIRPRDLAGQIAVVEASAGSAWQQAAYFGARAILILGASDTTHVDLRDHELLIPAYLPRFYIPPGPLAETLRRGDARHGTIRAAVTWQPRIASNLYVLLKSGQSTDPAGKPPAALLITAPIDSSGLVPDLAPGASQAVQTAVALGLLRKFAASPPQRPVVFCFTSGDSIQMLGQRNMLMALADPPRQWRRQLNQLAREQTAVEADLNRLRKLDGDPSRLDVDSDRRLMDRIIKLVETESTLAQDELFRIRRQRTEELTPELLQRRQELEARTIQLNVVRFAFQSDPKRLTEPNLIADGRQFLERARARLGRLLEDYGARQAQLQQRVQLYEWLAEGLGRNRDPDERDVSQRLIDLQIGLDLSDSGSRVGPLFWGWFQRSNALVNLQDYRDWAMELDRRVQQNDASAGWWGRLQHVLTFETLSQVRPPQSYLCAPLALPTEMAQAWGIPAMTLATLDDLRLARDTPVDHPRRIHYEALLPQVRAVSEWIIRAWNDPRFAGRSEPKRQRNSLEGQVVSPATGRPVPDLPREGFLISYYYTTNVTRRIPQLQPAVGYACGVRRTEVVQSDAEGKYRIEGLPQLVTSPSPAAGMHFINTQAYRLERGTGAVVACSDLGKQSGELRQYADIRLEVPPQKILVFGCEEFSLFGLYDPRYLQELGEVVPLDARRNADPQRFNLLLHRQILAGFLEPGTIANLLFRYGRIGNRLLLLNMPEEGSAQGARGGARGFSIRELNELGPLALATARDFLLLDRQRLTEYRKAGVRSTLIDDLHSTAARQLQNAREALTQNDAVALVRDANGAWANEARVYDATRALASDVVRGAIFLLLLCAPFSFCMERLLVGTANVYRQITFTALIFALMTAALWSFHPAFKISTSPLIIILAFAIIFMSAVVIFVVYSRFDVELKRLRSTRGSTEGASLARASVLMSAVLLGIANMRKRKFRTALTSLTIVLITFAVLCFTSARTYVGTRSVFTGQSASHPGIMIRQRSFRPMTGPIVQNVAAIVGPEVRIVERWWNVSASEPRDQIAITSRDRQGTIRSAGAALLGLSPGEAELSRIAEVIGPREFDRLEKGQQDVIFLSRPMAQQLAVSRGDRVRLGGIELQVAAVFDPDEFDQKVFTLPGEPITPLRYTTGLLDASGRRMDDESATALDIDDGLADAQTQYEHLSSAQVAIVPARISAMLPNGTLRSIGFRLPDQQQVKQISDELSRRFGLALFAGFDDGVRLIAASNLADVSGGGRVAIPLLIGGMIIFNTMMGSIAERRREIHVYTSLGLAPLHVGALFVAEALTYGLIGTVFGYIIGQALGTLLANLGWLGGATLNYSGTSAILTMGLILLVVLLSALVPARLASRIAAPSIDRTWQVPRPQGDIIHATLPFTINRTAADGVVAYLAEFLRDHQEGSIGKFSADRIEPFAEDGRVRGIRSLIWLTPFDLGVRQQMDLKIQSGSEDNIFEVHVQLKRLSGDDGSWYRMNRTFLTELRKQFLAWRSLTPSAMRRYVEESRQLLGG
ncbi:MAG: ABC transporter permease [Phycisphaerae bacterium]|nr:ABC transporter permease [Phycisphaerae bacterium]MDW8261982.1 FtsX-like permease family protein [Phycisphaerales bacterium]